MASPCRRLPPIALALIVGVLTFETGNHSVHHLADAAEASCVVAAVGSHVDGLGASEVALDGPAPAGDGLVPGARAGVARASVGITATRAPPASSPRLDAPGRTVPPAR